MTVTRDVKSGPGSPFAKKLEAGSRIEAILRSDRLDPSKTSLKPDTHRAQSA